MWKKVTGADVRTQKYLCMMKGERPRGVGGEEETEINMLNNYFSLLLLFSFFLQGAFFCFCFFAR